jgi:MoaA/NifB/PqqE/SkfB family radical SAM enzyme
VAASFPVEEATMSEQILGPPGRKLASIQLHVSRRCNIRCLHCYSHSGPEEGETLALDLARRAVGDAVAEGYGNLAISGGEPLLYKPLRDLLAFSRKLGMVNTVTTNGMLLDARRLAVLEGVVDLIAISLDGAPESHDRMRNSPRAFETMRRRLPGLRESGIPFGFLFTLTQHNLHELDWVADFALEQGATTLQIHPLEEFGRAREELVGEAPDGRERSVAFLEFVRLQSKVGERLHLQIDLADSVALRRHPERVYADSCGYVDASARAQRSSRNRSPAPRWRRSGRRAHAY